MTADLIERLRQEEASLRELAGPMGDTADLLHQAADALEAAQEDADRLDWLEQNASSARDLLNGHRNLVVWNTGHGFDTDIRKSIDSKREARRG